MSVQDTVGMLSFLISYCAPCALLINLTSWGVNVIIGAVTGRGLNLDGRK